MRWLKQIFFCATLLACASLTAQETPQARLLRFPDIHGGSVAFVYGGDIWLVSAKGGTARRITSDPGLELFPKFSPDGKWIAFTGQYDGNSNVYVMPAEGGQPRQLTFYQGGAQPLSDRMGVHNEVVTWTPDGRHILFLTRRDSPNVWTKRLYSVSIDGGQPVPLALDQAGLASFNADGTKIAYNRIFRNFRTWKRYTGGMAQDIYIYDMKNNVLEQTIPHTAYTDTFPMWRGNTIYFTSDRGPEHRLNLYSYDLTSKQIEQLTHFTDFDVMWPSLGENAIVFENGGYLYILDLATRQATKLTIQTPGVHELAMKHWTSAANLISDLDIAPDGKRVVMTARGKVFTVPAKDGATRMLTRKEGSREKEVAWSPDGRWIAYVSDRSGEDEIYITPQDGMGNIELGKALSASDRDKEKTRQITSGSEGFMFQPVWSQDSKKLAWADQKLRLWYVDLGDKKPVQVDRARYGEIVNYSWSPDSKWIAYDKQNMSNFSSVYLYSLDKKQSTAVTGQMFNSDDPVWDPEGKYLYFLSDRDYNEVIGSFDFEFTNPKSTRVYLLTLRNDLPSPFPALSDETQIKPETPAPAAGAQEKGKGADSESAPEAGKKDEAGPKTANDALKDFRVDLDGIENRVVALPIPPAIISGLAAAKGFVYYSTTPVQGLSGPLPGEAPALHAYDMSKRKETTVIEEINRWWLSHDGTKILYEAKKGPGPGVYGIIDAKPAATQKVGEGALSLAGLKLDADPPAEWRQIFDEVWRQERDYFFEASMNGVNWKAVHDKYAALLPYVASRYDLTYILGEMVGELSNSHTYVNGPENPDPNRVTEGLLGADYEPDATTGYYRFKKIYAGENWDPQTRSPLTGPGLNVKQGDYLLAINGRPLKAPDSPDRLLVNTANETTAITINAKPSFDGARTINVKPLSDEFQLRMNDMIETNRRKVDAATNGRVGYIYLPDMEDAGLNLFVKQYYPQIRKEGLIIDVRYNGGGFVDQMIFERLRRILAGMELARNWENGSGSTIPPEVFHGYIAAITNQYAASDGDIFSEYFKVYKLGPLIGERTWGGVRGIRGMMPLIDGGSVSRPEFSVYGLNSKWIVENQGVEPDIVVDNRPDDVVRGKDAQLDRAIQEVMKQIEAHPKSLPAKPADLPAYPNQPGL